MSMTLDEVRKTRFHMSRRNGYEVTDVDIFVDRVEATLTDLLEQNEHMRRQLELSSEGDDSSLREENKRLKAERENLQMAASSGTGNGDEIARLTAELEDAQQARAQLQAELDEARSAHASSDQASGEQAAEIARLTEENARLREQAGNAQAFVPVAAAAVVPPIVVTSSAEASSAVVRLVQLATEQAEHLVNEAQAEAASITSDAQAEAERVTGESQAKAAEVTQESGAEAQRKLDEAAQRVHEMTTDARTKADRVESEARVTAERLTQDSQSRAANVDREVNERRAELFSALEAERDDLVTKVDHLRGFELSYRENLTSHLQSQIDGINNGVFQPDDVPHLLSNRSAQGQQSESATPRLDALLGDKD